MSAETQPGIPESADSDSRPTFVRYSVLAWLCLIATITYIQRNSIAVAEEAIAKDLGLNEQQMGWIMGAFFLSYSIFQIPSGLLADRWGTRRGLALMAFVWSLSTALMGVSVGLVSLFLVRFLMGISQAGVFPCATNSIAQWFPAGRRALAAGSLASFMSFGGAVGAILTGRLIEPLGWRWLFVVYSIPGVLWAIGFYFWFRDRPGDHSAVNAEEQNLIAGKLQAEPPVADPSEEIESTPWLAILSSPAMWCICGQQFFRAAGYIFFATWFPKFLRKVYDLSDEQVGDFSSLPILAVIPAGILGGLVSDWIFTRTGSRKLSRVAVASAGLLLCAACFGAAYFASNVWWAVGFITIGSFFATFAGPPGYTITMDMGGRHVATVFSTMNMSGNLAAAVFSVIVPWFVKLNGGNWNSVLLLLVGIYIGGALCWLALKPNGNVFEQSLLSRP
jgi:MFS family permease